MVRLDMRDDDGIRPDQIRGGLVGAESTPMSRIVLAPLMATCPWAEASFPAPPSRFCWWTLWNARFASNFGPASPAAPASTITNPSERHTFGQRGARCLRLGNRLLVTSGRRLTYPTGLRTVTSITLAGT
jgi:hypothetical protein